MVTGVINLQRKLYRVRCIRQNAEKALLECDPGSLRDAVRDLINDCHGIEEDLYRLDLKLKSEARAAMTRNAA